MEHPTLSPEMLVADLLATSPLAASMFIELRADCIGCSMNKFCTLQEVCRQYEMDLETVMKKLQERLENHASH